MALGQQDSEDRIAKMLVQMEGRLLAAMNAKLETEMAKLEASLRQTSAAEVAVLPQAQKVEVQEGGRAQLEAKKQAEARKKPEQLVILGAGSEACNGTYAHQGESGDKPSYVHTGNSGLKVVWMAQYKAWSLSGGGKFYYKNTDATLRDGGSAWQKSKDGTEAVPTHRWAG